MLANEYKLKTLNRHKRRKRKVINFFQALCAFIACSLIFTFPSFVPIQSEQAINARKA